MNVIAHRTFYAGVEFRSRLEAKWAAFFDLAGWSWEYEPHDLRGYVPDFIIHPSGRGTGPCLAVEVKPLNWDDSEHDRAHIELAKSKLAGADWEAEALIVGANVDAGLGLIRDDEDKAWTRCIPFRCLDCGRFSFLAEDYHWHCRAGGCYDGNGHIDQRGWDAVEMFRAASNAVQWRPR